MYEVGDIVKTKKKHPCGSDEWKIIRTGMDFGISCCGCKRYLMLSRLKFEKSVRNIINKKQINKGSEEEN